MLEQVIKNIEHYPMPLTRDMQNNIKLWLQELVDLRIKNEKLKLNTMTDIEFFVIVAKMRQAQKKFFATRSNDPTKAEYLKESKRLEKIIDSEIIQRLKSINVATLKEAYKRFAANYDPQQKLF